MHLSFLSDERTYGGFVDDTPAILARRRQAEDHIAGLVRGILLGLSLVMPLALSSAANWLHHDGSPALPIQSASTDGSFHPRP